MVRAHMPAYAIGIDVGGTFTDCFLTDGTAVWRGKSATTPGSLADGLLAALEAAAVESGRPLAAILAEASHVALGTTAVTNCLAALAGARTGLLVTAGFRDLWAMARGHRLGRDGLSRPLPILVPRRRVAEVDERVDRAGAVVVPLDQVGAARAIDHLVEAERIAALAVCFLWSFRNPVHEQRVAAIARARHPALHVSCSAELFPVIREYERMTSTVLNAYSWWAVAGFLDVVEERLAAAGSRVPVAVMQSNGGTCTPGEARVAPLLLAQSGPVAGVSAARAVAEASGLGGDVITGDMGGTSFDVAVMHDGALEGRTRAPVGGLWTATSTVAIDSIGAGGGSVAWVDARGVLCVGPRSVGADPGPACYGRGGTEPAVTDALVALGLLDPHNFLGGRVPLDGESAVAALGRVGRTLGYDAEQTARGVYRLAGEHMALAIKGLLVERGLDPRRFTFLCYGGCGALFGTAIARVLGIRRVVVPALAAVFSAYGAATADRRHEAVQTVFRSLPADPGELAACFAALEGRVRDAMALAGVPPSAVSLAREVDLRFHRQTWEVTVPLPSDVDALGDAFRARYAALYGSGALALGAPIDLVNCRVIGIGRRERPAVVGAPAAATDAAAARRGTRLAWLPGRADGRTPTALYDGEVLRPDMTFAGPALVERRDTTILVGADERAAVDAAGSVVIEVGGA